MDERLRELERRWRETGAQADEDAWLRERVRQGDPWPERIHFPGNPWPRGHAIESLEWTGRLTPTGLFFDLVLRSADYDEDDEPDAPEDDETEAPSDWEAKIVWRNFHACTIEANKGFLAGTEAAKLDLGALPGREFRVDPLPGAGASAAELEHDELAFHIYLLGHDTVAGHRIRFAAREDATTFWLRWTGRIALTYVGREDFAYDFAVPYRRVSFRGIVSPKLDERTARDLLARFVVAPEQFELRAGRFVVRPFPLGS